MQKRYLWLGFAATLLAMLAFMEFSEAQPGKKGPGFGKKGDGPPRPASTAQIVDRILAFDKNDDGKVTKDELPERMQHLLGLGDVNKDGALDRSEIVTLATTLESFADLTGGGQPGGPGGGKGGPKGDGFKGGPPKGGLAKGSIGEAQRTLDELNLAGQTREKADRVIRTQQDKQKKFDEQLRAQMVSQMKDILNDDDYRIFKSAMDRFPPKKGGPGAGPNGPPDLERRIDQLQKELEDLRKTIKK